MDVEDTGLGQALKMVEERFGPKVTTGFLVVVVSAITIFCLSVTGGGIKGLFDFLKENKLLPENSIIPIGWEPYVVFFIFLVILMSILWVFFRKIYGIRRAPQRVIDELSQERSLAINNILNKPPKSDEELDLWVKSNNDWYKRVVAIMNPHLTQAERLKFERLGILMGASFSGAYNEQHNHELMMFAKRLSVLEGIIDRHMR